VFLTNFVLLSEAYYQMSEILLDYHHIIRLPSLTTTLGTWFHIL